MEADMRERWKNWEQDNDTAVCVSNVCGRICRSSVGLYSHQLIFTENKLRGADNGAKCWDMRRNKASMKNMKTPVYHMGERVPVRYKLPKHKVQKKTWALNSVVVDCRHGGHRYKISFNPSNWNALVEKWIHHNCSFLVNAVWTNWENDGHGSLHEIIWSDGRPIVLPRKHNKPFNWKYFATYTFHYHCCRHHRFKHVVPSGQTKMADAHVHADPL